MERTDAEVLALAELLTTGEEATPDALFSDAYTRLHRLAHDQRRRWRGEETLSTTALVHEAYLKLSQQGSPRWESRRHFFRVAARAMRHILMDYAKRSQAEKRGGKSEHVPTQEALLIHEPEIEELLALDEALIRLERRNPRQARVVECRFFAGLEVEETAEALSISPRTVMREWRRGKAWLYLQLAPRVASSADGDRSAATVVGEPHEDA